MATAQGNLTPLQRFFRLLRHDQGEVKNVYVYAIFAGLVNLSLPLGIQAIVNLIQGGRVSTAWLVLVLVVVLGLAIVGILQIQQMRIVENLQQKIFSRAAFEFAYRIPRVRTDVIYNHYGPELMNRFFDVLTVQKGLPKILIDFSVAALQTVFGLLLLSLYHPFFIAFGVILVVLVALIFVFTARPGLETSLKESKYKYTAVHWLEEIARTASTFKLAGKTDMALKRMDNHVDSYLTARESHFRILIRQYSLLIAFKVIVALGLLAIGGILVMDQQMNIGQFVAAEIIILFIMASVEKMVVSLETVYDILTGLEKIGQVTDLELDRRAPAGSRPLDGKGGLSVQLENVQFTYPGQTDPTLRDITLNIEANERVIVTGSNGAGKSTLVYIIAGLYDVQQGTIAYDNYPKGNLELEELYSVVGDCLRQGELFEGTVEENISMGRDDVSFDDVRWAVESMGLAKVIRGLPDGYATKLNPTGDKLPRNVVQRMLLARAIADRPRLLLLEDVLQAINGDDRQNIIDFLVDKSHPWTLVAVSNNKYLASCCTRVIEMRQGTIVHAIH